MLGVCSMATAQVRTLIYNSVQWAALKKEKVDLLKGVVILPNQNLKLDINKSGQIINLQIFEIETMNQAMVDGDRS